MRLVAFAACCMAAGVMSFAAPRQAQAFDTDEAIAVVDEIGEWLEYQMGQMQAYWDEVVKWAQDLERRLRNEQLDVKAKDAMANAQDIVNNLRNMSPEELARKMPNLAQQGGMSAIQDLPVRDLTECVNRNLQMQGYQNVDVLAVQTQCVEELTR